MAEITVYGVSGPRPADPGELPGLLSDSETLWVDITGPTDDDARIMREVFRFHPLAIEDTRNQQQRPKVEEFPDHLFVILNPVSTDGAQPHFRELDVFVGRNYLVTVHPAEEPAIEQARQRVRPGSTDPGHLLYVLVDVVVDGYFPLLDAIGDGIDEIEEQVLRKPQRRTLAQLFTMKRTLLDVRKVVGPQRDMFNVLTRRDLAFVDSEKLQYHLRDVYDHLLRISDMVDTFRDYLTSAVDLYMSAVSNRLNQVINRLTVLTVVMGTLAVITGFYGMNFQTTWPPFAAPWGVPFAFLLMATVIAVLLAIFRRLNVD